MKIEGWNERYMDLIFDKKSKIDNDTAVRIRDFIEKELLTAKVEVFEVLGELIEKTKGANEAATELNDIKNRLNEGWKPNWNDPNEEKWLIFYDENNEFKTHLVYTVQYASHYFRSERVANEIIKTMGKEKLKLALGIG